MLPLRHSNKNNDMYNKSSGSLIRKSDRPSLKSDFPYNGSASYYSNTLPSIVVSPLGQSNQFRQRPRPTCLPMFDPVQNRNTNTLNLPIRPIANNRRDTNMMNTSAMYGNEFKRPFLPPPPRSPYLDQVLTDLKPGPNVDWYCERKREKSKVWEYRKILVCVFVVLILGFGLYNCIGFAIRGSGEEARASKSYRFDVTDEPVHDTPMNALPEKEIFDEVVRANATILDGNFTDAILSINTRPATIKILYSINEDMESTVEVVEG